MTLQEIKKLYSKKLTRIAINIFSKKRIIVAEHTGTGKKVYDALFATLNLISQMEKNPELYTLDQEAMKLNGKIDDKEKLEIFKQVEQNYLQENDAYKASYIAMSNLIKKGMTFDQMYNYGIKWYAEGSSKDFRNIPLETMLTTLPPKDLPLQQRAEEKTDKERLLEYNKTQKELINKNMIKREKGIQGKLQLSAHSVIAADLNTVNAQLQTYLQNVTDIVRTYEGLFKSLEDKRSDALNTPDTAEVFHPQLIKTFRGDMVPENNWDTMSNEQKQYTINKKYDADYETLVEHLQTEINKETEILSQLV